MPRRFQVKLTQTAKADIQDIWTFIASDDAGEAKEFIRQLKQRVRTLKLLPERCPPVPETDLLDTGYRHLIFGKYRIIFRISGKTLYEARVLHGARMLDRSTLEW